jgi:hypothetical protein
MILKHWGIFGYLTLILSLGCNREHQVSYVWLGLGLGLGRYEVSYLAEISCTF